MRFDAAVAVTAVAVRIVAVVAFFDRAGAKTVAAMGGTFALGRVASVVANAGEAGFDIAMGGTSVAVDGIAVVAVFVQFLQAVATHDGATEALALAASVVRSIDTDKVRLDLAIDGTSVAVGRVAVVAGFVGGAVAVATETVTFGRTLGKTSFGTGDTPVAFVAL